MILGTLQSGKSTLFARLCGDNPQGKDAPKSSGSLRAGTLRNTGKRRFTQSWPWNTKRQTTGYRTIYDTPGISTLLPQGEDEITARDAIFNLRPSVLLLVADAKNLKRSLALVIHAAELELPAVLAVNMEDEAWRYGVAVDGALLSSLLGIEVVMTVATQNIGNSELLAALEHPRVPRCHVRYPGWIESAGKTIAQHLQGSAIPAMCLARMLLARDDGAAEYVEKNMGSDVTRRVKDAVEASSREKHIQTDVQILEAVHGSARRLADQVTIRKASPGRVLDTFGRLAHHPVIGLFIAATIVYAMYLWVGELAATRLVGWIDSHIFHRWLIPLTRAATAEIPWPFVRDALIHPDFGIIPTGLFLSFGLVLPVVFFFFFAFCLLRDSGYIPRLSILLDRVFRLMGLNGKAILPLAMGLSCVTMALITTRMLDTKRERFISSFLLMLGTPCAPLLAMMFVVLGPLPFTATLTVFGFIVTQTVVAGMLAKKLLPGTTSDFIMQIPPIRLPRLDRALVQTGRQTYYFMKEAVPLFLLASFVMFLIDHVGGLSALQRLAQPVVAQLLGLPEDSVQVFIKTMIRRESGAAELAMTSGAFTNLQTVITLLVMTFLTPCVNAVIVLIKERGLVPALLLISAVSTYAILVGAALNLICRGLGITFT